MASSRSVRAGRAFVEFFLEDNMLKRGLSIAERRMRQFGARVQNIGRSALTAGVGGLAATILPMRQMMAFDDAIRMTGAVSQSTAAELESLRQTALELGRTTSFTAVEVATLMGELGRAGFKPDEINRMTDAVLNLSRASGTDATLSAGIMAATLRQFSMGASEATRVSNVLTLAANATFNSVESLGEALSYAGPVAADLGMSLEDTVAILGTLGNVGIQGSNAGTALRRLTTITAAEATKMREIFGVEFLDAAGNVRPIITVMGELAQATNGLPTGERIAKMNEAFGLLGITGASVMANTAANTQELADNLRAAGSVAADTAKSMDAGPGGAWRILTSAIEGASIAIGTALAPQFQKLAAWITDTTGALTTWIQQNEGMIVSAVKLFGVLVAGGLALMVIGKIFTALAVGATVLSAVITALTTPWIAVPALAAGIVGGLLYMNGAFETLGTTLIGTFGGAWDVIVAKVGSGDLAGAMRFAWELTKVTWDIGVAYLKQGWGAFSDWLSRGVQQTGAIISEIWGVLWDSFTSIASYAWAAIKDTLQSVVDFGNKLVGRKVPNRKSNVSQVSDANAKRAEERAAENMAVAAELDAMIADGAKGRQDEVDKQLAKIDELIKTEKEKMDKPVEVIPPAGQSLNGLASLPAPERRLGEALQQGTTQAQNAQAGFVDAIDRNSAEGQRAIYEMLDQSGKKDTGEAIAAMHEDVVGTLEDEFERTRREDSKAPRIGGSRRG